jgi:ABC-type nitrate/sulfonate/bicarbonate transport system permease component
VLFGTWELAAGRLFDPFYFGKPSLIASQFAKEFIDPSFYHDLAVTGLELVLGYAIGALAGIAPGILLARWRYVARICDPFLLALNSIPRIAVAWIMTGLKMSLPFALVGVILGEFLVSSEGLGFRLNGYATAYNTSGAIAMILIMMFLMMALTAVADLIDARIMRWRPSDREAGGMDKA